MLAPRGNRPFEPEFCKNFDDAAATPPRPLRGADASAPTRYRTFRTLGLRHLIVVDASNRVRGMVTRKDLDERTLEERLAWASDETDDMESFSVEAHPSTMSRFAV